MKLLVTGGAGYVGSVVTALLLGAGHRATVLDDLSTGHADAVPEAVRRVTGRPAPVEDAPRRAGDPAVLVAANDRARRELGWEPVRTLDETVADAWEFARSRRDTA